MTVHFIGAGPGAPDLITVRGRDLLARCPVCLYTGALVPKALLAYCAPGTRFVDTAPLDCDAIEEEFVAADALGRDVARLHPCGLSTWSAMSEQIRRLEARGIAYTGTPGIPAYAAAAAALGRELTAPKISQSIVLTRVMNNSPTMPVGERLETFAATGATLVIHFSIHALNEVAARLIPFYGPACAAAVVFRASLPDERVVRGTLATLSDQLVTTQIERTAVLVVGPALAAGEYADRELYSLHYDRKFRRSVEYD